MKKKKNWNRLIYRMIVAPDPMLSETNQNECQLNQCWMRQYCIIYSTCICFASISVNLFAASFRMDTTNTMKFSLATSTTPTKPNPIQCLLYLTEYKVIYSEYFLSIRNITKNFLKLLRLFAVVIGILMCAFAQQATQKRSGFFLVEMSKAQ